MSIIYIFGSYVYSKIIKGAIMSQELIWSKNTPPTIPPETARETGKVATQITVAVIGIDFAPQRASETPPPQHQAD